MNKFVIIGLCLLFLAIIFTCKSKLTAIANGTTPTSNKKDTITSDTVMIFYAPWCGHCKNSLSEFTEASEQGNGKILLFNSDDPDTKFLLKKYEVGGFPTIMKGDGQIYDGPRRAKDIIDFSK